MKGVILTLFPNRVRVKVGGYIFALQKGSIQVPTCCFVSRSQPCLSRLAFRNLLPHFERHMFFVLVPSAPGDAVRYRKIHILCIARDDHGSDGFCTEENLRHTVPAESCAHILAGLFADWPNIRKPVVGIAHN